MEKQKNSKLGVWSLILSIIGATFPIAIILAIIDLSKKDGRKKTLSIISIVLCAFILTAVIASNISQNKKDNTASKTDNQSMIEEENESNEDFATSNDNKENDNSVHLTSYEHKGSVEMFVMGYVPNADFSFKNYHEWDDGAGFIMVENTYEEKGFEHTYLVRLGKDNVIYKLSIDDQVIFKADADALIEYMDKYSE